MSASATSFRSSRSAARATSTCTRSSCLQPERAQGVPRRPRGRDRRTQARRQVRLEGRRPDPAARHDLSGHVDVHAARHLRRRRSQAPTTSQFFFHFDYLNESIKRAVSAPRRPGRRVRRASSAIPRQAAAVSQAIDATFQQLARRNADRDREGVPARLRRDVGGDPARDPGGELRRDRHHHGGDGEHDGDDRARALRRVRDVEGAGLQRRLRRDADLRRIARHRARSAASLGIALTFPMADAFASAGRDRS